MSAAEASPTEAEDAADKARCRRAAELLSCVIKKAPEGNVFLLWRFCSDYDYGNQAIWFTALLIRETFLAALFL